MGWVKGSVVEKIVWTESLFSLRIAADIEPFLAGQYNRLRACIRGEYVSRPYSYVNPPARRPLEFFIRRVEGPLSSHLSQTTCGDVLELMPRSSGLFVLNSLPGCRDLWLLATGTGLGPYLSILGDPLTWERFENLCLVQTVRSGHELCYAQTIQKLTHEKGSRFRWLPLVTGEDWPGALRSRIPALLASGQLESAVGLPLHPEQSHVMLCGNPDMVADTQKMLQQRGLERSRRHHPGQITVENYW
jgi:ferredoxin--NADP+ reductase